MNIEQLIKDRVPEIKNIGKAYVTPDIPDKKVNNAVAAYAQDVESGYILAVIDTTIFGSGKEGFLFTGNRMYFGGVGVKRSYDLNAISDISEESRKVKAKDNSVVTKKEYYWVYNGEKEDITLMMMGLNAPAFIEFVREIIEKNKEDDSEFESTDQLCPLSMMDEGIKEKYFQFICNFAYSDDDQIDSLEYSEIMVLLAMNSIARDTRIRIRSYMYDETIGVSNDVIIDYLNDKLTGASLDTVKLSLVKDIINIFVCKRKDDLKSIDWRQESHVVKCIQDLDVDEKQVDYIVENIVKNKEIITKRQDDIQIKKSMQDLFSKAGAVGVPLAAVYLSGSVVGISAAGMTSGLAALGMGGVLGFSSMFTGIGVAVLLGVGTYKGIKKITGMGELERNKQREMMLKEIAKNSQRALNYLVEDVNEISRELQEQILLGKETEVKVKKLAGILAMMTKGAKETSDNISNAEKERILCQLPARLKPGMIEELAPGATKKSIRELISGAYSENRAGSDGKEEGNYLNTELSYAELEQVYQALQAIGYYKTVDNSKAQAKGFVKGIFDRNES